MREGLLCGIVIGMSVAFLWHFSNIVLFGQHIIQEPNLVILVSEIVLISACLIFAIVCLIQLLRSK